MRNLADVRTIADLVKLGVIVLPDRKKRWDTSPRFKDGVDMWGTEYAYNDNLRAGSYNEAISDIEGVFIDISKLPIKINAKKIESLLWTRFPDLQELTKPIAKAIAKEIRERISQQV